MLGGRVGATGAPYQLGIFPYLPAFKLEQLYAPMAAELARVLERPLQLKTKSSFEAYRAAMHEDVYDIILVHPFLYVEAIDHHGYQPLARVVGELRAVVLGRSDEPALGMAGLRGRTLALPPPLAGVSRLIEMELLAHGLVPGTDVQLRHLRNKVSCLHAVALGDADGCAVPSFMLEQMPAIEQMGLAPIARTRALPNLAFAASARLDAATRARLEAVLVGLYESEAGRFALERAHLPKLVPATDEAFEEIRSFSAVTTPPLDF